MARLHFSNSSSGIDVSLMSACRSRVARSFIIKAVGAARGALGPGAGRGRAPHKRPGGAYFAGRRARGPFAHAVHVVDATVVIYVGERIVRPSAAGGGGRVRAA